MTTWTQAKQKMLQDKDRRDAYEKVDLKYEIGKMITDARIAKNMTQYKLAELVGTKQPSIARLESGNALPSLSFLQKIANAFDTQLLPPRLQILDDQMTYTHNEEHALQPSRDLPWGASFNSKWNGLTVVRSSYEYNS